ncbi:MAG: hypothetical protein RLZZ445_133 [Pseudomonadota bacterium]|jgi:hypothetical protein
MRTALSILTLVFMTINSNANATGSFTEEIISIKTRNGNEQSGVLSRSHETTNPKKLVLLVSGNPSVTRPRFDENGKITTRQNGNFLVRSRHYLLSPQVITLLLDCRSDFDSACPDDYQASAERAQDIEDLVAEIRRRFTSVSEVWAVSTSRGTITTAGLLKHKETSYTGIIHTAGTYGIAISQGVDFGPYKTPQFIFHHKHDPCRYTFHRDAARLSEKWGISLVTVSGGSGFKGDACQAFTQHGFAGREEKVSLAIRNLVETGVIEKNEID